GPRPGTHHPRHPPRAGSAGRQLVPWGRARAVVPSSCRGAELVPGPARPRQRSTSSTAKHDLGSAARAREAHRLPRRTSAPAGASSYPRAELVACTVRARHRGTSSRHGAGHDEGPHRTVRAFVTLSGGRHLTVTVAPAASSCSLALSACSLATPSRTGLGAPSTRS